MTIDNKYLPVVCFLIAVLGMNNINFVQTWLCAIGMKM